MNLQDSSAFAPASKSRVAAAGVIVVIFLYAIDGTIVSIAMPTVVARLGGLDLYSWVFSIYMLTSALATPLCGKLSDLFGRRRLILIGIAIFTLGSALCGSAQSMGQLVVFRAIQGIGGGAIYALSFIIVGVVFPGEKRAKMQGLISGVWGISSVLAPLLGGLITQYWSWRWIFFINLPGALVATALITAGFREPVADGRKPQLDLKGAVSLLLGLLLLFYALTPRGKASYELSLYSFVLLVLALAILAYFFVLERRAKEPIIPPALFRLHLFKMAAALATVAAMGVFGVISYLPLYIQGVLGGTASTAGTALLLASVAWTGGSVIAGQGMNRFGYRAVCVAGMALMALGYGLFMDFGARVGILGAMLDGVLVGTGMGMVNVTTLVAAQNGVPIYRIGVATATVMLFRTFGGAFGVSLMGSVLFTEMYRQLVGLSAQSRTGISAADLERLANPQNLMEPSGRSAIPERLLPILVDALGHSIWYAFLAGFAVMFIGFISSLFMDALTPATTPRPTGARDSKM